MLLDYMQREDRLSLSYWGDDGLTHIKEIPLEPEQMFNWKVCKENDPEKDPLYRCWDGKPVKRVDYPETVKDRFGKERMKYPRLSSFRLAEIIDDLPKPMYDDIFSYNIPRHIFVDIETAVEDEFPKPEEAKMPITCIGFATQKNKVYVYATKELSAADIGYIQDKINKHTEKLKVHFDFVFKKFQDETTMLNFFLTRNVPCFPLMSGWNFIDFDWTYMYNRAVKLGLDPKKSSSTGVLVGNSHIPLHVGVVDYMECYKKWDTNVEQKENYKLDQAGLDVLGMQKVHYTGSLQDLYNENFRDYIYYNAIDCILVERLHEKLGVSVIGFTLAYIAKAQASRMFSPVALTESIMARDFYKQHKVLPPKEKTESSKGYEGAYVKQPKVGYHRFCTCNDFASLYPNIIRLLNLSPETFVTKIDEDDEKSRQEWLSKGYIVSRSGCVFSKEPGVFSTLVGRVYNQRKEYKKKSYIASERSFKLKECAEDLKLDDFALLTNIRVIMDDPEIEVTGDVRKWMLEESERQDAEYSKYHNWEQGTKILINSFYGGLANSFMYFFNVDLAECITKQGKDAILYAERNINRYFKEYWHKDKKAHEAMGITVTGKVVNDVTVYIDTDSCDKNTVIHCEDKDRTIEELYNHCSQYGDGGNTLAGHESNLCDLRVLNYAENKGLYYANVKRVIRHKVTKKKWVLKTKSGKEIIVTNDHSLVVFRNGKQVTCKPCEVLKNDTVLVSFLCNPCDLMLCFDYQLDEVEKIECIGNFENEYVYDIEMDDDTHTFIGNDILVHNSVYSQYDEVISTTDWGMGEDDPNWRIKYKKPGDKDYRYRYFCGKKSREYVIDYFKLDSDEYLEYEIESVEGTPKDFALLIDEVRMAGFFEHIFEKYAEKINAKNYLNFELESYADSGIWLAKKKYMQNIRWLDKIPRHESYENCSKIKSKGVELIQASSPSFVRKSLNSLVKWIFGHDNFKMKDLVVEVKKIKRDYMVADIEEICWNKKPSNYWQYVVKDNKELELSSGTPITVKGLALYNFLLNENPVYKSKYNRLKDGMMCKYYYCKYDGCEMFAFEPGVYPVEFAPEANRDLMFQKTILDPLNRILDVIPNATHLEPDLLLVSKLF